MVGETEEAVGLAGASALVSSEEGSGGLQPANSGQISATDTKTTNPRIESLMALPVRNPNEYSHCRSA